MTPKPKRPETPEERYEALRALALILADEARAQGVVLQTFTFLGPALDLPEGDSITIEIRREKQVNRVHLEYLRTDVSLPSQPTGTEQPAEWLHIGSVPAGVDA